MIIAHGKYKNKEILNTLPILNPKYYKNSLLIQLDLDFKKHHLSSWIFSAFKNSDSTQMHTLFLKKIPVNLLLKSIGTQ
jgi:hypothetical protein